MNNNDKFLDLYRQYESLLRDQGKEYKDIEENADDLTQNRMRIDRQMRNYLTHQDDPKFLSVSDAQIAYISKEVKEATEQGDILKKHLKTPKAACCQANDLMCDVLAKMNKLSVDDIVVLDKNGLFLGSANIHDVIRAYLEAARPKQAKMDQVKKLNKNIDCFSSTTPMSEIHSFCSSIDNCTILCTQNGKLTEKVIGVYIS